MFNILRVNNTYNINVLDISESQQSGGSTAWYSFVSAMRVNVLYTAFKYSIIHCSSTTTTHHL